MVLLTDAITSLRPSSTFILHEEDYAQLEWLDSNTTPPTLKQCQDEIARLEAKEIADQQTQTAAKQSALNKLMALGLTEEEALALGVK
jgi:hypothetical protein